MSKKVCLVCTGGPRFTTSSTYGFCGYVDEATTVLQWLSFVCVVFLCWTTEDPPMLGYTVRNAVDRKSLSRTFPVRADKKKKDDV